MNIVLLNLLLIFYKHIYIKHTILTNQLLTQFYGHGILTGQRLSRLQNSSKFFEKCFLPLQQ